MSACVSEPSDRSLDRLYDKTLSFHAREDPLFCVRKIIQNVHTETAAFIHVHSSPDDNKK